MYNGPGPVQQAFAAHPGRWRHRRDQSRPRFGNGQPEARSATAFEHAQLGRDRNDGSRFAQSANDPARDGWPRSRSRARALTPAV